MTIHRLVSFFLLTAALAACGTARTLPTQIAAPAPTAAPEPVAHTGSSRAQGELESLAYVSWPQAGWGCAATVVHNRMLVTAEHCVCGFREGDASLAPTYADPTVLRIDGDIVADGGRAHYRASATRVYTTGARCTMDGSGGLALIVVDRDLPAVPVAVDLEDPTPPAERVQIGSWGVTGPDGLNVTARREQSAVVRRSNRERIVAELTGPNASACLLEPGGPLFVERPGAKRLAGVLTRAIVTPREGTQQEHPCDQAEFVPARAIVALLERARRDLQDALSSRSGIRAGY